MDAGSASATAPPEPKRPRAAPARDQQEPLPPETQPLRIDSHTHILPADWPDFKARFGYDGFIRMDHHTPGWGRLMKSDGTFFREVEADLWSPDARLEYMDNSGIDVQVCCTVPVMFSYFAEGAHAAEVARFLNDDLAATCAKHPTRLLGLGTLPMQAPARAVEEVRRLAAVPRGTPGRLEGFQIGSHIENRLPAPGFTMTLDDERLFPVYAALEEAGMALMVHPWDMIGKDLLKKYWLPWLVSMPAETSLAICAFILGGVFKRFPRLRVLFAHAGGSFPATVGRVQHGFDCRPDLVAVDCPDSDPTSFMGQFWVDHLTHSRKQLEYVIELVGEERVCFGTDYPFPLGECYPLKKPAQLVDELMADRFVDAAAGRRLLGLNTLEWLGLDPQPFLASSHRASKMPEATIVARHHAPFAASYTCTTTDGTPAGDLVLAADGAYVWNRPEADASERSRTWHVGTYGRDGTPNTDVVLVEACPRQRGCGGRLQTRSEWVGKVSWRVVLDVAARTARVVDKFAIEHLKRRSGKNSLLEGQRAVGDAVGGSV